MTAFPEGFKGVAAKGMKNGNVQFELFVDGKSIAGVELPPQEAGGAATAILAAAMMALQESGRSAPKAGAFNLLAVPVSNIGIGEHPTPGHCTLLVQIGEAGIAFELTPPMLRSLGQALLAASAPDSTKN